MLSVTEHKSPKEVTTVLLWAEVVVVCQMSVATIRPNQILGTVTVISLTFAQQLSENI